MTRKSNQCVLTLTFTLPGQKKWLYAKVVMRTRPITFAGGGKKGRGVHAKVADKTPMTARGEKGFGGKSQRLTLQRIGTKNHSLPGMERGGGNLAGVLNRVRGPQS